MNKIFVFPLLLLAALFMVSCGQAPKVATKDKPAPDFTLADMQGKKWILSQLKGQVVFVNFWATWCPPCREEMPSMQRLFAKLPQNKFKMLAVLNRDEPKLAVDFAGKLGLTMPILNDQDNAVGQLYGLTGVPETFIVDKKGVIREKFIGPAQWDSPAVVAMIMNYINE